MLKSQKSSPKYQLKIFGRKFNKKMGDHPKNLLLSQIEIHNNAFGSPLNMMLVS